MLRFPLILAVLTVVLTFGPGCGGSSSGTAEAPGNTLPPPPSIDPSKAATVSGRVLYDGPKPEPAYISMDAVPSCARQHAGKIEAGDLVVNENGTLRNAFVWIKSGLTPYAWPVPPEAAKLDQQGCIYTPRVLGVRTGQPLAIYNSDPVNHNINCMARLNEPFNESEPPQGDPKIRRFDKQEVMITVRCNVHPWMRAYLGVVDHPFFTVTDAEGNFRFEGLPAGTYEVEAWHERFGAKNATVTVGEGQTGVSDFHFQ